MPPFSKLFEIRQRVHPAQFEEEGLYKIDKILQNSAISGAK